MNKSVFGILLAAIVLSACTQSRSPVSVGQSAFNSSVVPETTADLGALTYRATDALIERGKQRIDRVNPIIVTSLANIDDLRDSSTFGRLIGDQASSRLVQQGLVVRDVRLSNALVVREGTGELILSRDVQQIGRDHQAQAVVAGTYAIGGERVYVNLRLIAASSGQIISSVDFVIPLDRDTKGLIVSAMR